MFNFHILNFFFFQNWISFSVWYLLFLKIWSVCCLGFLPWCIALYLLIMKSLVSIEIYSFDQRNIYWKPVAFLAIWVSCFPKIVEISDNICPHRILFTSYKVPGECLVLSILERLSELDILYSLFAGMSLCTGLLAFTFPICYYIQIKQCKVPVVFGI